MQRRVFAPKTPVWRHQIQPDGGLHALWERLQDVEECELLPLVLHLRIKQRAGETEEAAKERVNSAVKEWEDQISEWQSKAREYANIMLIKEGLAERDKRR